VLGLLAIKPEHQHAIADRGALQVHLPQFETSHSVVQQQYTIWQTLHCVDIAVTIPRCDAANCRCISESDAMDVQGLVGLLKQHVPSRCPPGPGASVARRAADAITNLAHENVTIKCKVRAEGGVPPLVALLESFDAKVQLQDVMLK
jgi:hypothetical protein